MHCLANLWRLSVSPTTILRCNFQTSAAAWKGHAKWQNIKHIKMSKDTLRAKLISQQMRNVRLAVQEGGGSTNPSINTTLRNAIEQAVSRDVPQSTIKTTLKKLSETPDASKIQRHLFEGRLYGKVFLVIPIYTENLPLARNQMATPFKKHHFTTNNTKHMFNERGVIHAIARPDVRIDHFEDDCLSDAVEVGAEDVEIHDVAERQVTFYCEPNEFVKVKQKLTSSGYKIVDADCHFIWEAPTVKLNADEAKNYEQFKERLQTGVDGFEVIYDNVDDDEEP